MVGKLSSKVQRKPTMYHLAWVHDRDLLIIRKQCIVIFLVGPYKDQVLYHIIHMTTTQLLLGHHGSTIEMSNMIQGATHMHLDIMVSQIASLEEGNHNPLLMHAPSPVKGILGPYLGWMEEQHF